MAANNGTMPAHRRLNQLKHDAKYRFGLTLAQAQHLRTKNCEICGKLAKKMCLDHIPGKEGTHRGVLCQQCNTRLGWYERYTYSILDYASREPR